MDVYRTPRGQKYYFSDHGAKQTARRKVKQANLEDAIDHYDRSEYDRKGNVRLVRRQPDGRELWVTVDRDSDPLRIITVIIN